MKKNLSPSKIVWAKIFRSPRKPKLSRKIVQSSRVNLNLYWKQFEADDLEKEFSCISLNKLIPDTYVLQQNAINDNLANERIEEVNNGR